MSRKLDHAIDIIINGSKKLMNLGKVIYWNKQGGKKERYFINTLGMGLDAEIAKETKQIKFFRGFAHPFIHYWYTFMEQRQFRRRDLFG